MSKTYETFLSQSPEFKICRWGKGEALGFGGNLDQINSAWYLFCNYDREVNLHWLSEDFAYIGITLPRIKDALKLFFYVNILHSKEVKSEEQWNEEEGIYTLIQDTDEAIKLAEEDINNFISNLQVESFIPIDHSTISREYAFPAFAL